MRGVRKPIKGRDQTLPIRGDMKTREGILKRVWQRPSGAPPKTVMGAVDALFSLWQTDSIKICNCYYFVTWAHTFILGFSMWLLLFSLCRKSLLFSIWYPWIFPTFTRRHLPPFKSFQTSPCHSLSVSHSLKLSLPFPTLSIFPGCTIFLWPIERTWQ